MVSSSRLRSRAALHCCAIQLATMHPHEGSATEASALVDGCAAVPAAGLADLVVLLSVLHVP